ATVSQEVLKEALESVVALLSPFVPHLSEELWERLGNEPSIFNQPWPGYDASAVKEEKITIVVQVNGKVRSRLTVPVDINEEDLKAQALANERIRQWTAGKEAKKVIVVPRRLVNIVTQ
ncbi:class I tRNA ligase family protein, partial [candidate division NPL-UPA2 bacterium]|nr:class I tRNA ligase family protein [candidate division NPL-UPA2 bacterium]